MTLASELKQRQDIARDQLLTFQLKKIPIVEEAIRQTSEYGYSPDLPVQVIVDCLKDTHWFLLQSMNVLVMNLWKRMVNIIFIEEYSKASIRLLLKILNGQSKIFLMFIILVLIR